MNATLDNPIFMRVQLPLNVLSVQLPIVLRHAEYGLERYSYQTISRTLCPQEYLGKPIPVDSVEVTINSGSSQNISTVLEYNLTVSKLSIFDLM
jgi:hypothetical protein